MLKALAKQLSKPLSPALRKKIANSFLYDVMRTDDVTSWMQAGNLNPWGRLKHGIPIETKGEVFSLTSRVPLFTLDIRQAKRTFDSAGLCLSASEHIHNLPVQHFVGLMPFLLYRRQSHV